MLALKLILVPSFLALISLAGRRWGPGMAGWLAGMPVVAGPILFFLALERGTEFGAQAAAAACSGAVGSLTFNITYARTCLRHGWPIALLAGFGAWLVAATALAQLPSSPWAALTVALAGLLIAPRLFPDPGELAPLRPLPKSDLPARMIAGAALTLLVTGIASNIGPTWSGLLGVYPLMGTVLAVFSHVSNGASFAVRLLRAMARGLYSFAAFCFCIAISLPSQGILLSFSLSVALALCVQFVARERRPAPLA